jgi:hypothetical protein
VSNIDKTPPAPACGPDACYVMTDADADYALQVARETDAGGYITRPSGTAEDARYRDRGPGHAAGWTPRQQVAAAKLGGLWKDALKGGCAPTGYSGGGKAQGNLSEQEEEDAHKAWKEYCEAIGEVERQCSMRHANALRMVIVYAEPSPLERAWMVREGLTFLANWWKLR